MGDLIFSGRVQTRRALLESIKAYMATLDDYDRWKDFFESGVGTTTLNILTGIAELLMFKVEVRSRESYLYTAQTKSAVYLLAQMMGYNPNRKKHSTGLVTATVQPYAISDFIIPKGMQLEGAFPLVIDENYQVSAQDRTIEDIVVKQGEWVEKEYSVALGNLDGKEWEILHIDEPEFKIDDFEVYITVNDQAAILRDKIIYTPEELDTYINFPDVTKTFDEKLAELYANTVVARTDYRGGMMIMFGDGIYGKRLTSSSEVKVRYLRTEGLAGQVAVDRDLGTYIIGNDITGDSHQVSFKVSQRVDGGSNEDNVDKVKMVASRFFQAQARAVTKFDYEAIALAYPGVVSAKAARIDDSCCTICISALKADTESFTVIPWNETEIAEFLEYLDSYKMLSTLVDFWEPEPVDLNMTVRIVVKYGSDIQGLDIKVREYIQTYCFDLGRTFRTTKLVTEIMGLDANINRVYIDNINGSECYPDINLPCYGFFEQGSVSVNFQVEYT